MSCLLQQHFWEWRTKWCLTSPRPSLRIQGQNHFPVIESLFICADMRSWWKFWWALFALYIALQNLMPRCHDCRASIIQEAAASKCCQSRLSLSAACFICAVSFSDFWLKMGEELEEVHVTTEDFFLVPISLHASLVHQTPEDLKIPVEPVLATHKCDD